MQKRRCINSFYESHFLRQTLAHNASTPPRAHNIYTIKSLIKTSAPLAFKLPIFHSIMKFHLQLSFLSILSTVIRATPMVHLSTDVENQETQLNIMRRDTTPTCSASLCGQLTIENCLAELEAVANFPSSPICISDGAFVNSGPCQATFASQTTNTACISQEEWNDRVIEVFTVCVQENAEDSIGGCIDVDSVGGRVCLRSSGSSNCF